MRRCSPVSRRIVIRRPALKPSFGDRWRISILTDSLVRFEWSDAGVFVDERTQSVVNRDFGEPAAYTVRRDADGWLDIETERLRIVYDGGPFTAEGLAVSVKDSLSQHNTWRYGDAQNANLGGTVRTLDQIDGPTELEPGLLSGDGWMILDDSDDNLVVEASEVNGSPNPFGSWVARKPVSSTDLYFSDTRGVSTMHCMTITSSPDRSLYCLAGRWATGGVAIIVTAKPNIVR